MTFYYFEDMKLAAYFLSKILHSKFALIRTVVLIVFILRF